MEIIKTAILSLIAIAIIHHLYLMFKNNLTIPKTKFINPEINSSIYNHPTTSCTQTEHNVKIQPTSPSDTVPTQPTKPNISQISIGDTTSIDDLVTLDATQNEQKTQLKDYIKNITVTTLDN